MIRALKEWNLDMSVEEVIGPLIQVYEINEDVVETVKKARSNGYKTLVCTNNIPARINRLQKRFGFLGNFDAAALSYEVSYTKPSKK